ncbi:MAG: ATP-binding protein [Polaribacter sp.]|nr:ATP-binding protein [Polaribacter sp.]
MQQKILLIGGPGTGKTSVLNELIKRDYFCFPEISREVTLKAQQQGIDQMFLAQPLLFSQMLLEGREQQFIDALKSDSKLVFFDRGIPDIHAYMDYFKTEYPSIYIQKSKQYIYDKVFHFAPWKDIHETDNERYETFEGTIAIDVFLMKSYLDLGYNIINVPFGSIDERTNFVLNSIS